MAHTLSSGFVSPASPIQNRDSSGNVEQRGAMVCCEIDITSYTNGGEVVNAAELGLNVIYNAIAQMSAADTYAVRSCEVAAGGKSFTLNVDTAGSGTEVSGSTDIDKVAIFAWGEQLGSGSN